MIRTIILALAFALFANSAKAKKPNVIILVADQLRYQSVGFTDDRAITPNIDKLRQEGILFKNFVANTPVCSAFRGSMLTGKYASSTGYVVNELRINPNHDTIAHVLKLGGYRTDMIGKWHLWTHKAGGHHGAENNYVPPGPYRLGFDDYWATYNFGHNNFKWSYWTESPEEHKGEIFKPTHFTNLAIERIKKHASGDDPFAMVVAYSPPHDPFTASNVSQKYNDMFKDVKFPLPPTWREQPDPYMDRNTQKDRWINHWKPKLPDMMRAYYAMTTALDVEVGRLMQALKDSKIDGDTIVIFTSDHGEMFGAHGRVFKMIFYEESVRVPFIVRWPKNIPAGAVSDACMATPDIMPTILGLTGQPSPIAVEGMDLSQITLGKTGPEPEFALMQGIGHTYLWKNGFEWRAIRDKQYTYGRYLIDGKELLFDNKNDPTQAINLATVAEHAKLLKTMRDKMNTRMTALSDGFHTCTWYRDNWTDDRVVTEGAQGVFKRQLGPTIPIDTTYSGVKKTK
ncbi:MAG: sulfatase [Opitutales bacterium]|nr:sulfatase [Opitutales bacterium]